MKRMLLTFFVVLVASLSAQQPSTRPNWRSVFRREGGFASQPVRLRANDRQNSNPGSGNR